MFDVNITSPDGDSIARQLQADPEFRETPVVFLGVNASLEGGVISGGILSGYSFVANPIRIEEFVRYVAELFKVPAELLKSGYRASN